MLRHLDLFSGIGGFALAARMVGGYETVGFCEIEPYCQAVLRKHWPDVPIHDDVRKLTGRDTGSVDVISGGYPCQPFSLAGKRAGAADDRHLWPEFARLVSELRPAWVLAENVAGHVSMGLDVVLSDLEGLGYSCRPFTVPACGVDAKHRRERLWIVAHAARVQSRWPEQRPLGKRIRAGGESIALADAERMRELQQEGCQCNERGRSCDCRANVGDAISSRLAEPQGRGQVTEWDRAACGSSLAGRGFTKWLPEPDVGRVAHGIPARVDRLRGLGNAIVPQVAAIFLQAIKEVADVRESVS